MDWSNAKLGGYARGCRTVHVPCAEDEDPRQAPPSSGPVAVDIGALTVTQAERVIGATSSADLLRAWAATDERKGIADAVAARLAEMGGA